MSGSHWLLLIPYYFFGALACLLFLVLFTRLARLRLSINTLATAAVVVGLAFAVLPVATGCLGLHEYSVARLAGLVVITGVLALLDACLQPLLPAPLDKDLQEL